MLKSIDPPPYGADIVAQALETLTTRLSTGPVLTSPADVRAFLRLKYHELDPNREHFGVLYLDSRHALVEWRVESIGTLTETSVYPRELARAALTLNACAVILAHNHPSGSAEPSKADIELTAKIKSALKLLDVRVLDHFVVGDSVTSMAERGLV